MTLGRSLEIEDMLLRMLLFCRDCLHHRFLIRTIFRVG